MTRSLLNLISYQAGWFACILGAAYRVSLLGPALAIVLVALHLAFVARRSAELMLLIVVGLAGSAVDALLATTQMVIYRGEAKWLGECPLWITALWVLFATTFSGCLAWLRGRYFAAALLGFAGGPLAYWGAERLGAVELHASIGMSLSVLAVIWMLAVPATVWLADRIVPLATVSGARIADDAAGCTIQTESEEVSRCSR